jgi:hypothetical protein
MLRNRRLRLSAVLAGPITRGTTSAVAPTSGKKPNILVRVTLKIRTGSRQLVAGWVLLALLAAAAQAQETTGSPDATTTIDGRYLPAPPQRFEGQINLNAAKSKSAWPARVVPPKGAPNILLILTDDVGFGAPSTFGGVISTPALDRIAASGLRYTNFHSTALCSPTRAALITADGQVLVCEKTYGCENHTQDRLATVFDGYPHWAVVPLSSTGFWFDLSIFQERR